MTNKDTEIRDDDVGGEDGDARRRKDEARSDDEAGPSKRRRVEEDQVSLALKKIGTHIGNEKKFKKASALLQQLLDQQEAVTSDHAKSLFDCCIAAFKHVDLPIQDPTLRKDFSRLVASVDRKADVLASWQRSVMGVYKILYSLRLQLFTDDSFAFAKVVKEVQTQAEGLSRVGEGSGDEEAYSAALTRLLPQVAEERRAKEDPFGVSAVVGGDHGDTGDIFGIAELAGVQDDMTLQEIVNFKREALLRCFTAMKEMYGKAWAKTTIDLAFQKLGESKDRFCEAQQETIASLVRFSSEQKAKRKAGGGAGTQDMGKTEMAEKAWAKQDWISKRGSVGGGGGGGSNYNWLG